MIAWFWLRWMLRKVSNERPREIALCVVQMYLWLSKLTAALFFLTACLCTLQLQQNLNAKDLLNLSLLNQSSCLRKAISNVLKQKDLMFTPCVNILLVICGFMHLINQESVNSYTETDRHLCGIWVYFQQNLQVLEKLQTTQEISISMSAAWDCLKMHGCKKIWATAGVVHFHEI